MLYQVAKSRDLPECSAFINESGLYDPVNFEDIGGIVFVARETDSGPPIAVVWFALSGCLAFQDYLLVGKHHQGNGVAIHLLEHAGRYLVDYGVREVRYTLDLVNAPAIRMAAARGDMFMGLCLRNLHRIEM